jgi:hypothetical protein
LRVWGAAKGLSGDYWVAGVDGVKSNSWIRPDGSTETVIVHLSVPPNLAIATRPIGPDDFTPTGLTVNQPRIEPANKEGVRHVCRSATVYHCRWLDVMRQGITDCAMPIEVGITAP